MATSVPAGTIWQFALEGRVNGQRVLNTQLLQITGDTTIENYQNAGSALLAEISDAGNLIPQLIAALGDSYTFVSRRVQPIYPERKAPVVAPFAAGTTGLVDDTPMLPANVAAVLTKRSVEAARWGVGSVHLTGLSAVNLSGDGTWDPALLTTLADIGTKWAGAWLVINTEEAWVPVLWGPQVPNRVTLVTSVIPEATCRVMRRRTVGVGE